MKNAVVQVMKWWLAVSKDQIPSRPTLPSIEHMKLSGNLLLEEYVEVIEGMKNNDLVEMADGCCDLIWVAMELMIKCGIDPADCFNEVARSNLQKVIDGKVIRREDGKILKPPGWTKPDIKGALEKQCSIMDTYKLSI